MLDPWRILLPEQVQSGLVRFSSAFNLPALPLHAHEVLFAVGLYTFVDQVVAPVVSKALFPKTYSKLDRRTRVSWNVHFVSTVQALIINALAFYVIFYDDERRAWRGAENWDKRIWGYTGLTGLLQSFALGYFIWDLYMCIRWVKIFGAGMIVHAIASSTMFTFGFRPFIHFWAPVFLLHELSTPFLNIHWFCDKLNLTGSIYQAVNGAILTATFFGCRLVWGTYGSIGVGRDVYRAVTTGYTTPQYFQDKLAQVPHYGDLGDSVGQTTHFMNVRHLPLWLGASYLLANVTLTGLNFFWFSKMVATIRKRFDPPFGTKGVGKDKVLYYPKEDEDGEDRKKQ